VLLLAAVWIPHNILSNAARNEASAARNLRILGDLENQFVKMYPAQGYTCDFSALQSLASSTGGQFRRQFPMSESFEGYKYSLGGCEDDQKGVVSRFKATAVPLVPKKTGFRAFCIDQTLELRYGMNEHPGNLRSCSYSLSPLLRPHRQPVFSSRACFAPTPLLFRRLHNQRRHGFGVFENSSSATNVT